MAIGTSCNHSIQRWINQSMIHCIMPQSYIPSIIGYVDHRSFQYSLLFLASNQIIHPKKQIVSTFELNIILTYLDWFSFLFSLYLLGYSLVDLCDLPPTSWCPHVSISRNRYLISIPPNRSFIQSVRSVTSSQSLDHLSEFNYSASKNHSSSALLTCLIVSLIVW